MPKKKLGMFEQRELFIAGCKFIERARKKYCGSSFDVFGIDPSISSTGYVYRKVGEEVKTGVIVQKTYGFSRLVRTEILLKKAIGDKKFFVGLEDYAYGSKWGREQMGELGGVIRRLLYKKRLPMLTVSPTTLKAWLRAKQKSQIMLEILDRYKIKISNEDAADAFVLADIVYNAIHLANDVVINNLNSEDVRLYLKNENYKTRVPLKKLYKYQANSLFRLIFVHGVNCEFFLKSKPTLEV